jgi:SAM-dependent methyltransferase
MTDTVGERPWWQDAFGRDYQDLYAHRSDHAAAAEMACLLPRLAQAPGPILDVGCGNGRHLESLRAAGIDAYGIDLSPDLLSNGSQREHCRGRLLRCDMRLPALTDGWGGVLLLFTAFGYFDDAGNAALLSSLAGLLAPGGWLLLDLPDPAHLAQNLVPSTQRRTASGMEVTEERALRAQRVEKTVILRRADRPERRYTESVRLYSRQEIADLARASGLELIESWPGLYGRECDDHRQVHWLRRGLPPVATPLVAPGAG